MIRGRAVDCSDRRCSRPAWIEAPELLDAVAKVTMK